MPTPHAASVRMSAIGSEEHLNNNEDEYELKIEYEY